MEITIKTAQLNAQEIQIGEQITLQELRLTAKDITVIQEAERRVITAEANATIIMTEVNLNRLLMKVNDNNIRDLEIAMLTGRVRVSGRYTPMGRLGIPFSLTAVPDIEGGARVRLDPRQMSVVGAPLPNIVVNMVVEKINTELAKGFDITRLPIPMRLTSLTVEPGRFLLGATAKLELSSTIDALDKRITGIDS